jgi:hypothetical protein
MTIVVNGKEIETFENDTDLTLLQRIASAFNTIPEYIHLSKSFEDSKEEKDDAVILIDKARQIDDFDAYLRMAKEYFPYINIKDVVRLWLLEHRTLGDFDIIIIENTLESEYNINFRVNDFLRSQVEINNFLNNLTEKMKVNKEKVKTFMDIHKTLAILKKVSHTPFSKEKSSYRFITDVSDDTFSIQTIFAKTICNDRVVFASFDGIYKIFNSGMIPPREWSITSKTSIILKILSLSKESIDYIDCIVSFVDGRLEFSMDIDYSINIDIDDIRNIISKIFYELNFSIVKENEESIAGITMFPNESFDNYVMSDLIMNNNIFSNFMVVDESVKATKKKGGLHLHFFIGQDEGIGNIITRRVDKKIKYVEDEILIKKLKLIEGSTYIRLRIKKVKNLKIAEDFITIFSKLLNLYKEKYNAIVNIYKVYIPNFAVEEYKPLEEHKALTLKEIAPDLFGVSKYTRSCSRPPIIISDKEAEEYKSKDIQVMKFPKTPEEGDQYNYTCPEALTGGKAKYIGLRINNLENKKKYRYIPCCYEKDQISKKTSDFNDYYLDNVRREVKQQAVYTSDRISKVGVPSHIPKNFGRLLDSFNNNYTYMRIGMHTTPKSFLECVLEGTSTVFSDLKLEQKETALQNEFDKLLKYQNIIVAAQENPGKSSDQIRETLRKDGNVYMDPRRWVRLCEVVYKCKIYIFSRPKETKDVILESPYHEKNYLSWEENYNTTVIVYEHWGGENDHTTIPMCELVVKWNVSADQLAFNFGESNKDIPLKLDRLFNKFFKQYYYSTTEKKLIQIGKNKLPYEIKGITHQYIDSCGKLRALIGKSTIITDPLPPLNLPEGTIDNMLAGDVQSFVDMKRVALLLVEYFILMFSKYMYSEKVNMDTDNLIEVINFFINDKVIVDPSNKYKIPSSPSTDLIYIESCNFIKKERLVVDDIETLKRLIYCLRLRINTDIESVKNYFHKAEISNFYINLSDYLIQSKKDSSHDIVIVKDLNLFQDIDHNIYNKVQRKDKYFIKNEKIFKDNLCLVSGDETDSILNNEKNYKLYLYSSKDDVKTKKNTLEKDKPMKSFIAYKRHGRVHYSEIQKL